MSARAAPAGAAAGHDRGDGITIGVRGGGWRGRVNRWGAVYPADGTASLDWWVAAEDRWHTPAFEPTVRQRLLRDTPVVETALRVPGGDVVHRTYAVGHAGGLTVVEVENATPSPVALVFSRRDLLTSRPTATVAPAGLDAAGDGPVLPIGHRGTIRVALAHDGRGPGTLPSGLPSADEVANGWTKQTQAGVRLDLPPGSPTVPLTTLRCQLLLEGVDPSAAEVEVLVGLGELIRLGEPVAPGPGVVVAAAERVVRAQRRSASLPWTVDAALASAAEVLGTVGWSTAGADLAQARRRLAAPEPTPAEPPAGLLGIAWAQRRVVVQQGEAVDLFPAPYPAGWLGQPAEAHGVPIGRGHLGVALRWHGARPAILWGADEPVRLSCSGLDPTWSATTAEGEVLLRARRPAPR